MGSARRAAPRGTLVCRVVIRAARSTPFPRRPPRRGQPKRQGLVPPPIARIASPHSHQSADVGRRKASRTRERPEAQAWGIGRFVDGPERIMRLESPNVGALKVEGVAQELEDRLSQGAIFGTKRRVPNGDVIASTNYEGPSRWHLSIEPPSQSDHGSKNQDERQSNRKRKLGDPHDGSPNSRLKRYHGMDAAVRNLEASLPVESALVGLVGCVVVTDLARCARERGDRSA
jgi:hypothetical protein